MYFPSRYERRIGSSSPLPPHPIPHLYPSKRMSLVWAASSSFAFVLMCGSIASRMDSFSLYPNQVVCHDFTKLRGTQRGFTQRGSTELSHGVRLRDWSRRLHSCCLFCYFEFGRQDWKPDRRQCRGLFVFISIDLVGGVWSGAGIRVRKVCRRPGPFVYIIVSLHRTG